MALIEKRDLTTPGAIQRICRELGLNPAEAGYAGLKDRRGVARQWISLQRARPEDLLRAFQGPDLRVLEAAFHRNKLRTGHLRGNRFRVVLRDTEEGGLARAREVLRRLGPGMPNYYGEQRFGRRGDNAEQGLRLLRGELRLSRRDRFKRRLLVSALQAKVFNEVLAHRMGQGQLQQLLGGEVLQRADSGGMFVSEPAQREVDARRLADGEVVITGPLLGPRMPWPAAGSPAHELEQGIFQGLGLTPEQFAPLGRIARGGRRPLTVSVGNATVEPSAGQRGLALCFMLPPGAYATVLLREVAKCRVRPGAGRDE
jgi:tRNA pseudouridine13 synthase